MNPVNLTTFVSKKLNIPHLIHNYKLHFKTAPVSKSHKTNVIVKSKIKTKATLSQSNKILPFEIRTSVKLCRDFFSGKWNFVTKTILKSHKNCGFFVRKGITMGKLYCLIPIVSWYNKTIASFDTFCLKLLDFSFNFQPYYLDHRIGLIQWQTFWLFL